MYIYARRTADGGREGGGLRVAGCGLRVAGCGLRVAGCGLWEQRRQQPSAIPEGWRRLAGGNTPGTTVKEVAPWKGAGSVASMIGLIPFTGIDPAYLPLRPTVEKRRVGLEKWYDTGDRRFLHPSRVRLQEALFRGCYPRLISCDPSGVPEVWRRPMIPQPATRNPQPATRNPQPATRNPQPATLRLHLWCSPSAALSSCEYALLTSYSVVGSASTVVCSAYGVHST